MLIKVEGWTWPKIFFSSPELLHPALRRAGLLVAVPHEQTGRVVLADILKVAVGASLLPQLQRLISRI